RHPRRKRAATRPESLRSCCRPRRVNVPLYGTCRKLSLPMPRIGPLRRPLFAVDPVGRGARNARCKIALSPRKREGPGAERWEGEGLFLRGFQHGDRFFVDGLGQEFAQARGVAGGFLLPSVVALGLAADEVAAEPEVAADGLHQKRAGTAD